MEPTQRELAALMTVDIAAPLPEHGVPRPAFPSPHSTVKRNSGNVLGALNGSFIAKFGSPEDAVLAGLEYCEKIKKKWPTPSERPLRVILTTGEITFREGTHSGSAVEKIAHLHRQLQQPGFFLTGEIYADVKKMIRTNYSRAGTIAGFDGPSADLFLVNYEKDILKKIETPGLSPLALNAILASALIAILALVGWTTLREPTHKKSADVDLFRDRVKNAIFKDNPDKKKAPKGP